MFNPSHELDKAIEAADRAYSGMLDAGVSHRTLQLLQAAIEDLRNERSELPQSIYDDESDQCPSCMYGSPWIDREPYGDRTVDRPGIECNAQGPYQCPRVRDCGFTDPSDPVAALISAVRRQAK